MKGLELSRAYWEKCALPLFRRELPAFLERAAVGLVGEGSVSYTHLTLPTIRLV